MRRLVVLTALLVRTSVWADPAVPDPTMVPDASVGEGGAQMGSEESDTTTTCMSDNDCDHGTKCVKFRCTWQQYRQATCEGCGGGAVGLAGVGLMLRRRRRGAK